MKKKTYQDHLGNSYFSKDALCKKYNISIASFNERIEKGYTLEEALTKPCKGKVIYTDFDGVKYTNLRVVAKKYNVNKDRISAFLKQDKTFKQALRLTIKEKEKNQKAREKLRYKDHKGNRYTSLRKMCEAYGISRQLYLHRKKANWPLSKILETSPHAVRSNGEYNVEVCLKKHKVKYKTNETIRNFFPYEDFGKLSADFIVNDSCIIEFDGCEHFSPWRIQPFEKRIPSFLKLLERDNRKTALCEKYKIPLLRIRYDQINLIPELIEDFLSNPKKYVKKHNKLLSNKKYWEIRKA